MALTPRQERFVAEYLIDLNAARAYRTVYRCSAASAEASGSRLLGNVEVGQAVAAKRTKQLAKADLSAVRVLEELRRLSFFDPREFWDTKGNLRPIHQLSAEAASALAGFEAIIKNAVAGDGKMDLVHKIKFVDKTRALEMLAKHFKLLTDVVHLVDEDAMIARLNRGRDLYAKVTKP